jgi:octaprenyl-diphosphate synthase
MLGFKKKRELHSYAACLELAHNSTLLHDDVIDEAEVRRGKTSANRAFGNAASVIVGDYVLFKSFHLAMAYKNLEVLRLISRVSMEMAEGEAYQLALKGRPDLTEDVYEKIIRSKTALLIQAACEIPGLALGLKPARIKALADFGYHLGVAFQIADDVLDYAALDKGWGKKVGKDFEEGKTTLPAILACQTASAADRETIRALFHQKQRTAEDLERMVRIMAKYDALDAAKERARRRINLAKSRLASFPDNPARRALAELADYVVLRKI